MGKEEYERAAWVVLGIFTHSLREIERKERKEWGLCWGRGKTVFRHGAVKDFEGTRRK